MKMIRHTLDALAAGGIRDHLGGGFHRYSTDAHWLVPHFEIMLYDNAMLAWIYAEAFAQTGVQRYEQVARRILDFLLREMRSPKGLFYTALDAEVDGMEGANYLWTLDEVRDVLGEADAEVFARAYGLNAGPNFVDPHHGGAQPEKNVLFRAEFSDSIAKSLNVPVAEIDLRLAEMREKLYLVRQKRKQPGLDTKILISWNALVISALARAGRIFKESKYSAAALMATLGQLLEPSPGTQNYCFSMTGLFSPMHGWKRLRTAARSVSVNRRQRLSAICMVDLLTRKAGRFISTRLMRRI